MRDGARWTHDVIAVARDRRLAEHRHLERIVSAAHAGTLDRFENRDGRAFPYGARFETRDFRLASPRLALTEPGLPPAASQDSEDNEDERADKIPTNSSRHVPDNVRRSVKDASINKAAELRRAAAPRITVKAKLKSGRRGILLDHLVALGHMNDDREGVHERHGQRDFFTQ